jgi:hypothetical protein
LSRPLYLPWFDHPNNIQWRIQVTYRLNLTKFPIWWMKVNACFPNWNFVQFTSTRTVFCAIYHAAPGAAASFVSPYAHSPLIIPFLHPADGTFTFLSISSVRYEKFV